MPLNLWRALRRRGVMGINQRNSDYVMRYNRRHLYPLVDDKLLTKEKAAQAGIPVPELYAVIESEQGSKRLPELLGQHQDFVIKPAKGAGGDGIIVISDRFEGLYRTAGGRLLTQEDLHFHISGILSGIYSLGGYRDRALVEHRVVPDQTFARISSDGVPDLRIIVLCGYPVMAMVRLPTRQSHGRANLHQGAIGVGVDLATGVTLEATWRNRRIARHPDTLNPVAGVALPNWREFLQLAAGCYELTGLGYLGVDMVLDHQRGPMMLELNARPGLNIQIANDAGLAGRCARVERMLDELGPDQALSPEERVLFCQREFRFEEPTTDTV